MAPEWKRRENRHRRSYWRYCTIVIVASRIFQRQHAVTESNSLAPNSDASVFVMREYFQSYARISRERQMYRWHSLPLAQQARKRNYQPADERDKYSNKRQSISAGNIIDIRVLTIAALRRG